MDCILHIGTEKTATTLLQGWLYANKAQLSSQGVFLSTVAKEGNNRKLVSWFQTRIDDWLRRQQVHTLPQKEGMFEGFEDQFRAEIDEATAHHNTIILTSEHFHSRLHSDEEILRVKTFLDDVFDTTTVVCYFRDQADMAVSLYSTLLRIAFTKPLDRYLEGVTPERRNYNHADTSAQWAKIFGAARCRFRVFDRAAFPDGDIRRDFLQTWPQPPDFDQLDPSVTRANESLAGHQARLYRAINQTVPHWKPEKAGVNRLNLRLKQTVDRLDSLGKVQVPQDAKEQVRQRFVESNSRFLSIWAPHRTDLRDRSTTTVAEAHPDETAVNEDVLADLLTALVSDHMGSDRFLEREDARTLMKLYRKFRQSRPDDHEGALALLELAVRAHPSGPQIQRALQEMKASSATTETPEDPGLQPPNDVTPPK